MILLDKASEEPWARHVLGEQARALRAAANAVAEQIGRVRSRRVAGTYIRDALEEAAILLDKRIADINPPRVNDGGEDC